jgi:hypothetical protein
MLDIPGEGFGGKIAAISGELNGRIAQIRIRNNALKVAVVENRVVIMRVLARQMKRLAFPIVTEKVFRIDGRE